MDQWDPMKEAFDNKHFNSYNEGVGRDLTGSQQRDSGVCLYVQNIPVNLGKNGLYNLFAEHGKVLRHNMKISDGSEKRGCIGFITMENVLDAETAIRKLDKFRIGQFTLKVSPALTAEERNRRRNLRQNEEMFTRGMDSKSNLQDREQLPMNESAGPALSSHGDWHSQQQGVAIGRGRNIHMTDRGDASHSAQGSLSHNMGMGKQAQAYNTSPVNPATFQMQATGDPVNQRNYQGAGRGIFVETNDIIPSKQPQAATVKTCVNCYKVGCEHLCSRCKMYYCSAECQRKDWPRHKDVCQTVGEMFQSDPVRSNGSIGKINQVNNSQGTHANKDLEITKNQMKLTDADRYASGYSDNNLVETYDKRNHRENNFRSGHQISSDQVGSTQFPSKLQNAGGGQTRSNHSTNLAESQSFHAEKAPSSASSDKAGRFQNAYKPQNNRCSPMENVPSNSGTNRYSDEAPARTTHSDLKYNKFQNNRNEFEERNAFSINKTVSQKNPQEKSTSSMNSKQERHFKNNKDTSKSEDNWGNTNKTYQEKSTNETMSGPNYQKQIKKLETSPRQLNTGIKPEKVQFSGDKTPPLEAERTSQSILELSLANTTSGSCCLTYFESPFKFWISLQEFLETFAENTTLMEQISKTPTSPPVDCQVGGTYAVRYMGEWCRVNVVSIKGREVTVFFLDYGNQDTVKLEDLRPLTKDMMELPAQAVCCSVSKIRPKGSESWSEAACKAVREWLGEPMTAFLHYETVARKGSIHFVNIAHKNMSMRELLLSGGFAESINYEPGLPALSSIGNIEPTRHMAHEVASIMDDKNAGDRFPVVLIDFISAKRIIVLDVASNDLLNELTSLLQSEYQKSTGSYRPVQGELVAAKFSEDGNWYRAEITSVDGDSCSVFFVDYGNSDVQTVQYIRALTKQNLVAVPKQALICSLGALQFLSEYDADIIEKEACALFAASIDNGKHCLLEIERKTMDALIVDFYSRPGSSFSDMLSWRLSELRKDSLPQRSPRQTHEGQLSSNIKGVVSPPFPAENTPHTLKRDTFTAQNLGIEKPVTHHVSPVRPTAAQNEFSALTFSMEVLPGMTESTPATVTHIDSGSRLFISRTDKSLQSELCQVMLNLNKPAHPLPHLDNVIVGSVCAAQYSQDGNWYRACVVEVCSQTSCIVQFVDYGNSEKTATSNLREIEPALTKLPAQAICCCLSGHESGLNKALPETSADPVVAHTMHSQLMDKIINVKVVNRIHNSWIIEVENDKGECINGKFLPPSSQMKSTPMLSDLIFERPSEKEFDAIFSYIKNLSDFYCQRCDTQELEELQALSIKLGEDVSKPGGDLQIDPKVNGIYASKFMGTWYRCVVEEVKMSNVLIRYIDYGNSEVIPANQLRALNPTRMLVPVRPFKCKLHGVTPTHEDWASPEMAEYLQILQQSNVHLEIVGKEANTFLVSLFAVLGSEKVNVAEDLVEMGMAKLTKVLSPPKGDQKFDLPYPHGRHHLTHSVEEDDDNQDELEIQRKIQELQMQLQLSQQKKKHKY